MRDRLGKLVHALNNPGSRPMIMAILNATPDSFYAASRGQGSVGLELALGFERQGADIIDIGAESTRPGASYISAEEEITRLVPLVKEIRRHSDIPISIDSRKHEVIAAALEAGADMVNDVSALEDDPELLDLVVREGLPVVLMHKKGEPQTMQLEPEYSDVVQEVSEYLAGRAGLLRDMGHPAEKILLDPGIGFGKSFDHNLELLRNLRSLKQRSKGLAAGVLLGYSRKGFLGQMLADKDGSARPAEARLHGGLGIALWACAQGVRCLRVHDPAAVRDAVQVWSVLGQTEAALGTI